MLRSEACLHIRRELVGQLASYTAKPDKVLVAQDPFGPLADHVRTR